MVPSGMAGGLQWDAALKVEVHFLPSLQKHPFRQNGSFREGEGDKNDFEEGNIKENNSRRQFIYLIYISLLVQSFHELKINEPVCHKS